MGFDHSKYYSYKKNISWNMFCFQYKRLLLKLISKYVHDLIVNVLLGVYWFPQSYWWYGMNILKVEFYPPTKGQPYLPKNFVKILNYSNKNTEIQCKFKTRRSIKTDKMSTNGKQISISDLEQPFTDEKQENFVIIKNVWFIWGFGCCLVVIFVLNKYFV